MSCMNDLANCLRLLLVRSSSTFLYELSKCGACVADDAAAISMVIHCWHGRTVRAVLTWLALVFTQAKSLHADS
jgi:hypothetical protein